MAILVYATLDDFNASPFNEDDQGNLITTTNSKLRRASMMIDSFIKTAHYLVDPETFLPTEQHVIEALRDATCAQAAWFEISQDTSGYEAVAGPITLGPLSTGQRTASAAVQQTQASSDPRTSPEAVLILKNAGLVTGATWNG
jgi:hypothetical protein